MTLRVYNTLTRTKENFQTIQPGKVGMYLCGPTVYKSSHVGHMVGPVIFDTIKRYLTYNGYEVTFVINITDVDDKLINRANTVGTTVAKLAQQMTQDYFENLQTISVDTVDHFPHATEHIPEMLEIVQKLIENDYAYPLDGDVYFAVEKDADYGKLSRRNIEQMLAGTRIEVSEQKRHPADFALWKKSKPDEPNWESPWGPGRPGWHIECSAMSMKYLGESFDIHGGGLDLMFPHHENELAQSESCNGKPFARYWMHNGLMQTRGAAKIGGAHDRQGDSGIDQESQETNKLAGSRGAASVKELFAVHSPETIRFFLLSTHYRSPIDFSDERINETGKSLEGFYRLFETLRRSTGQDFYALPTANRRADYVMETDLPPKFFTELNHLRDRFLEAMDDDFNTGGAVGTLFEMRKCINAFVADKGLDTEGDHDPQTLETLTKAMTLLKELANLLGVFHQPIQHTTDSSSKLLEQLMCLIIEIRSVSRKKKDFETADIIRDTLTELKITLEDRPEGTVWRKNV